MKLYCFWTGSNPMSENRKKCLSSLSKSGLEVCLITPSNLGEYLKVKLHDGYKYLSETHKADYLRTYFMNFYGGGYSDIKYINNSWKDCEKILTNNDNIWGIGYEEIGPGGVAEIPDNTELNSILHKEWYKLIGAGAYMFKPNTPLTKEWYGNMMSLMDKIYPQLVKYPSKSPQQLYTKEYPYPLRWAQLLGEIFHPIVHKYFSHTLNILPRPSFEDYK